MKEFLNRGLHFARKLTEQLCRKINERLFTEEKIEALIVDSLITHFEAGGDLDPDVKIEYTLVEEYTAEELALIESKEKGATSTGEPLAAATMYDEKHYFIEFALKPLRNNIFKLPPWQVKKEIHDMAKHEAFHVRQYNYICKHGGEEAMERVIEHMATTPYEEDILELGAYMYQYFDEVQDFETDFAEFIHPECSDKETTEFAGNVTLYPTCQAVS